MPQTAQTAGPTPVPPGGAARVAGPRTWRAWIGASDRRRTATLLALAFLALLLGWVLLPSRPLAGAGSLPVHELLEIIPIAIAAAVCAVGWEATLHGKPTPMAVVAAGFFGVAVLDFLHTLSYPGMPDFVTPASPEKALFFWCAARLLTAGTLLLVAVVPWGSVPRLGYRRAWLVGATLGVGVVAALGLSWPESWPQARSPTHGAGGVMAALEVTILLASAGAGLMLWRAPRPEGGVDFARLAAAAFTLAMAELFVFREGESANAFTIAGHVYKAFGFGLIYSSVVRQGLRAPYLRLAESEKRLGALVHEKEAVLSALSRHSLALVEVNQLSELLLTCRDEAEAWKVIALSGSRLFSSRGFLAISREDLGVLEPTASWGSWGTELRGHFSPETCWGLRRGQPHPAHQSEQALACQHPLAQSFGGTLCVPLMVQGRLLGLLHVALPPPSAEADAGDGGGPWRQLVEVFAAAVKSSLSNLQLRTSLHEQATHDVLTRLFNRRYLDETLPRELHRAQRAKEPLSVAMIDVDHFKKLNDTFGHDAGDVVLETLGRLLRDNLRFSDIACRFGGEEFMIVMPGTLASQAHARLDQLRELIAAHPFTHQARALGRLTVSVGIAQSPLHGTAKDELLRQADHALYMAKEQGRDRTVVAAASHHRG